MTDSEISYKEFFYALWGSYSSTKPLYYEIFILSNGKPEVHFFDSIDGAIAWLDNNLKDYQNSDVYYGVLPRIRKKKKGRGSEKDIESGIWLWVDLDFKREFTKGEFERFLREAKRTDVDVNKEYWYEEHKDFGLIGFYKSGNNYIVISRPQLSKVLEKIEQKLNIEPSIVVDSGNGYHLYFKLEYEIDSKRLKKLERALVKVLGADEKSTDLARVLRLPGSINQRTKRKVKIILYDLDKTIDPNELERKLGTEEKVKEPVNEKVKEESNELRNLEEDEILKIVDIIAPIYKEGQRHHVIMFLSGWLFKAHISYESAKKLIELLCNKFNDEECEDRLYTLDRTYGLKGNQPPEEKLKTSSGLFELFMNTLSEEEALKRLRQLEDILNSASPFKKDPIFALLNITKRKYVIALPNKRIIVTAMIDETDKVNYEDIVVEAYPSKVVVYQDPLDPTKVSFETIWESKVRPMPIRLPPLQIDEIVSQLNNAGLIIKNRLAKDIINAILNAYVRKGKAETKADVDAKGFFLLNSELRANRVQVSMPKDEDVKKALEVINKLRGYYDESKLAFVLTWGLASPFNFAVKQKLGNRASDVFPYLILYGESNTGKSTLSLIACIISGAEKIANETCTEVNATNVDTKAKLGMFLNDSAFMKPIKEAWGLFKDIDMVEMLKDVVDNIQARARIEEKSNVRVFLALRPILITMNRIAGVKFPEDSGFRRRYKIIPFTLADREKVMKGLEEFNKTVYPELRELGYIGQLFAYELLNNKDLQKQFFEKPIETAKAFLKSLLEKFGFESGWLDNDPEFEEGESEVDVEALRIFFINKINDTYQKYIGKLIFTAEERERYVYTSNINFMAKLDAIIDGGLLPWLLKKNGKYVITTGIKNDEDFRRIIGEINLKDLAELLNKAGVNVEYKDTKIGTRTQKVILIDPKSFEDFLNPNLEAISS